MKRTLTRIFTIALLTMVSMGTVAQVNVVFGEKGEEKFSGTGGTITFSQDTKGDQTTVTLTVTPDKGYTITKDDIKVYATYPPSGTRSPEIANNLTLYYNGSEKEDVKNPSAKRDYTFNVPSGFGAWVKEATFASDSKGPMRGGISSLSDITDADGHYIINQDISGGSPGVTTFSGTLEAAINPNTKMPFRIKNLTAPLFTTLTGTVKNLVLEDVSISGHSGNTGAIACTANDDARIYNVGILTGEVGGTAYTGGLVGLLDGKARVVNCYSFANITGGSNVGGIVGYNNVSTASNNLKTMVFACMFYGDITGGTTISPVYGGKIISNKSSNGVSNFNYFRLEARYVQPTGVTYNCALGAEDRFLQRFEFYRHLLNSHLELAGWWATGTYSKDEMLKWVFEPSQIGSTIPYPILKEAGKYPSVVNIDAENATTTTERNKGGKLGTLLVNIQNGSGGAVYGPPTGATIETDALTLNITDKDPEHFNFNYYKVQLPYYNDVGTNNYRTASDGTSRVVTGWKIVSITGGTPGEFKKEDSDKGYNFADRNCTNKDLYSVSGRVFNQGAYWDVPEGVTAITIEPYWAKAAYVADAYADVVYNADMNTPTNVSNVGGGEKYQNNTNYSIAGEQQKVYTSISNAVTNGLGNPTSNTVNDYAVVLVGNLHQYTSKDVAIGGSNKYTVTTIDLDKDNEPDYSFMMRDDGRGVIHPLKWDFLNIVGLGMAKKTTGGNGSYNLGILIPRGWFEATNTSLFRVTQFEYENSNRSATDALIVQGGVMEQWVSNNQKGTSNKIPYIHVGGNVWFKEFHTGCHQDKQIATLHSPISVTGGDYDEFYLTGLYTANVTSYGDNAECYINGGRFGTVCGAAMEGIGSANGANNTGNITWLIQNADIKEFYAGGLNAAKPVTGNLSTTIVDSHVDIFCGGPKFGDMTTGKTVTTTATGCTFGTFFGAGYGGNSYSRYAPTNQNSVTNIDWNKWVREQYKQNYNSTYGGVSTQFSYQFLPMSDNKTNVARIFVDYVKFSLATCRNVTSILTGCKITGSFYGGGSLGKVDGPVTSTLTDCEVQGSVFGAGFSASLPTVEVDSIGFRTEPYYYTELGTYRKGVKGATTTYTWQKRTGNSWVDNTNHILYTTEDLTTLGTVTGLATLNIDGSTTVAGSVYGGGDSSDALGNTEVNMKSGTVQQNIYGGGNQANVGGNTQVNLKGGIVVNHVFGGGKGDENHSATVGNTEVKLNETVAEDNCIVYGSIFGCNDVNGTPKGNVTVHIYKTNGDSPTASEDLENIDDTKHHYHLNAVYGGGNLAAYVPTDNNAKANVIIDGCDMTSIRTVYGGGNAASTPATSVVVNGTYEIEEVFGGGNGKDALPDGSENPGANVGFKNYSAVEDTYSTKEQRQTADFVNEYVYGSGEANVTIVGGRVHRVFGGSNTKGNVRITAVTMLDDIGGCAFTVEEAYGGGKSAPMDGEAKLLMSCIPGLKVAYGGAEDANILGDVTLNITNGNFDRVFGGNNISGTIGGKITVNIEETGCSPIIIGQLYGGGNQASYDANGQTGPTLNIKSFTSIGEVYGGGYGVSATVKGDTHVNINEVKGRFTAGTHNYGTAENPIGVNTKTGHRTISFSEYVRNENGDFLDADGNVTTDEGERAVVNQAVEVDIPVFTADKIGGIGMVYGGGNAAKVIGDTHVNVCTESTIDFETGIGNESPQTDVSVIGADIRGNVYGGGNKAEVTGNTNVVIGKRSE